MLKKIATIALSVIGVAAIAFGTYSYLPKAATTTEYEAAVTTAETAKADVTTNQPQEDKVDITKTEPVKTELEEEIVEEPVNLDLVAFTKDEAPDVDTLAYKDVATEEELHEFVEYMSSQAADVDAETVKAFFEVYGDKLHNWKVTPDGEYVHLLYDRSLMSTDEARPKASVELGLNKKQIDDAVSFPFTLNEEQVKKILAAGRNQKVAFSDEEVEAQVWEYFDEVLGNYVLAEDGIRMLGEQKIADYATVSENWAAGREFLEMAEASRNDFAGEGKDPYAEYRGKGANIWLVSITADDEENVFYTNQKYIEHVISYIMMLLPRDARVQVLKAKAGDHSHLIAGDKNSMRVTTRADYDETLASLVFPFYTKTGKVALYFGINERDKRAEVLNPTITKKPKPVPPVTIKKKKTEEVIPIWNNPSGGSSSGGSNPGGSTPPVTPPTETKSPSQDPVYQGNAQVGGGKNDDPGPGTYKEDQGNSKSNTVVEGSQYQQGTSSTDTNNAQPTYDSGPAADHTDGGTPPATKPIETHESSYSQPSSSGSSSSGSSSGSSGSSGGSSASAGDHNSSMSEPPADD